MTADTISAAPQQAQFFARSAIVMAVIVLLNFPLTYYWPAATRWKLKIPNVDPFILDITVYFIIYPFLIELALFDRRLLGSFHPATLASVAFILPLQLSSPWIARNDWWNALAPGLIGPP